VYIQSAKMKAYPIYEWLFLLVFYFILIYSHGYVYGYEDQVDFMPYALHLQQKFLYTGDFYIECMKGQWNERWFIAHGLALIPQAAWPYLFLVLHLGSTIFLIQGMKKFCRHFLLPLWIQWAVVATTLILFYHRNLGGNELYYNMVSPSLLAKSMGIWSLWYSFKQNSRPASLWCIAATYIQPIVGVQVLLLGIIFLNKENRKLFLITTLLCIMPYILSLYFQLNGSGPTGLVEVMQLRNPHHFMPGHFGWLNFLLLTPVFLWGMAVASRINKPIFYSGLFIMTGCIFYMIFLKIFPELIIKTQWFKSTVWLKFFSFLMLAKWLTQPNSKFYKWIFARYGNILAFIFFVATLALVLHQSHTARYSFPWSALGKDQDLAVHSKSMSQPDEVFLVPADFTAFKYYSERPTWVDWKAIPHQSECLSLWAGRIKLAYGLELGYQGDLNSIYLKSNNFLRQLSPQAKADLKSQGVDFIVFRPEEKSEYKIEKL